MKRSTRGCGCAIAVLIILLGASAIVGWKWVLPWWRTRPPKPAGELQVHVLDVGPIEGDSILIISPAGKAALIDTGDTGKGKVVLDALKRYKVERLDYFIATEPHSDHIGGADEVLTAMKVGTVIDNGIDLSTPAPEAAANPKGKGAKAKATPTPPPPKKGAVTAFLWRRRCGRSFCLRTFALRVRRSFRRRRGKIDAVIDYCPNFHCGQNFIRAADVIRMRLSRDEVVETLNLVALQRIEHYFALAGVAGINQSSFAGRRDNQDGIAFDRSDIEYVNLQLAGRFRRTRTPPGQSPFPEHKRARAQHDEQHRNGASASASGSLHLVILRDTGSLGLTSY